MQDYNHLIIDMNNCYWRNITGRPVKKIRYKNNELVTSGIEGSIKSINKFETQFAVPEQRTVWLLFDNPDSIGNLRKDIDPDYKSQRERMPEDMKVGIRYLTEILKVYKDNYRLLFSDKMEADDLVNPLLETIPKDESVLLISADMDWARSIDSYVHWYNWERLFTRKAFNVVYGFEPTQASVKLYKAFTGDKADSIPNPFHNNELDIDWRLRHETLMYVISECGDMDDFFKRLRAGQLNVSDKWMKRFQEVEARLRINYALVDFQISEDFDIRNVIWNSKYSRAQCRMWFDMFEFEYEPRFIDVEDPEEFFGWQEYKRI
jgi:5'-3' exonuclease